MKFHTNKIDMPLTELRKLFIKTQIAMKSKEKETMRVTTSSFGKKKKKSSLILHLRDISKKGGVKPRVITSASNTTRNDSRRGIALNFQSFKRTNGRLRQQKVFLLPICSIISVLIALNLIYNFLILVQCLMFGASGIEKKWSS